MELSPNLYFSAINGGAQTTEGSVYTYTNRDRLEDADGNVINDVPESGTYGSDNGAFVDFIVDTRDIVIRSAETDGASALNINGNAEALGTLDLVIENFNTVSVNLTDNMDELTTNNNVDITLDGVMNGNINTGVGRDKVTVGITHDGSDVSNMFRINTGDDRDTIVLVEASEDAMEAAPFENHVVTEQVTPSLMENGNYNIEGLDNLNIEVDALLSRAGYNNSVGHYFADADGVPLSGTIDLANIKTSLGEGDVLNINYGAGDIPEGATQLGFFIIPNGARRNRDIEDGTDVEFAFINGEWKPTVDGNALSGQSSSAYFSDVALNRDGFDHLIELDNGSMGWEDLFNGGDKDFEDATFTVDVSSLRTTVYEQQTDGSLNNTVIKAGAGNDRVDASAVNSADVIYGQEGNDILHAGGGNDRVFGGEGRDTIDAGAGDDIVRGGTEDDIVNGGDGEDRLFGQEGNDTMNGDGGEDRVHGGLGDDILDGGAGNDRVFGGEGNDRVLGGLGDDRVIGGEGNDSLYGDDSGRRDVNGGNDILIGGNGDDRAYGGYGDDILKGQDGRDRLYGGYGDDKLIGGLGRDTLYGEAGNDIMNGGEDNDTFYGGDGEDRILGGNGDDRAYGDAGNDIIRGHAGLDYIEGGDGEDNIHGGADNDTIYGGNDNDRLNGGDGDDIVNGNDGDDRIFGGAGNDDLDGDDENDVVSGGEGDDRVDGGRGDDRLFGGEGNDNMDGDQDNDYLNGGNGDDEMDGGTGDDKLVGGAGNDEMKGEDGNDILHGGEGNDEMFGNAGEDRLNGGAGNDQMFGGTENDVLNGGDGDDLILGEDGDDRLLGGAGNDDLQGGDGNDFFNGGHGDDIIRGGDGDDFIYGSHGNDTFYGERGNDTMHTRFGDDTFVFDRRTGDDVVRWFGDGDILSFNDNIAAIRDNGDDVLGLARVEGNNTIIDLGDDGSVTLLDYTNLTADDIMLF